MTPAATLLAVLALGQFDPYVRSRVTPGDDATQCLYWTVPSITWNQSTLGNPDTQGDTEFDAVRVSFQNWEDIFAACGNLNLQEGPRIAERNVGYLRDGENHNVVLFRTKVCSAVVAATDACWDAETCANQYDCWDDDQSTLAITLTTYDKRSGIIYDSDISFNASQYAFTTSNGPTCFPPVTTNCVSTDVQNTATHEIGHFVGLDHTRAAGSTMNPSAQTGEVSKRIIDSGSRDFVCSVYAKGAPSQACLHPVVNEELGPKGGGCSATGASSLGPALMAWVLWRRRRAREARS
ncbi:MULTISPECIES: myxosortase-dependent metalloprotease, MXAN_2677/MXAN_2678 family [Myxococcus]|uniref:myxosortase-dependent metalloprotease, MXAN_2677/MXAN_2678 family n=1 Tax=Myxococcus TaxID=32 RepID=UPI0013D42BC9|nr:myxosortase-dependent metalloprotease, MXAN_2677/MXAN_2678 family [Myxococcus eversor]NVJ20387.1 matrixin family metalloprotease [Myxococcus sp. AM011]